MTLSKTPPRPLSLAELQARWELAYPEAQGPGVDTESGAVDYGQPGNPRVGKIPHLLDPETRDRDNAEREARLAAMSPAERQAREDLRAIVREEMRHV